MSGFFNPGCGLFGGAGFMQVGKGLQFFQPSNPYAPYAFYADFTDGKGGLDRVSKQKMQTNIPAGNRYLLDGTVLGQNQPAIEPGVGLRGVKAIGNFCLWSEDITQASWFKDNGAIAISPSIASFPVENAYLKCGTTPCIVGDTLRFQTLVSGVGTFHLYFYGTNHNIIKDTLFTLSGTPQWLSISLSCIYTETVSGHIRRRVGDTATQVNIHKTQVTLSKYQLPYVPTTTAAYATPSEISTANSGYGNFFAMSGLPKLAAALASKGELQLEWTPAYPSTAIADLARLPLINLGIVAPGMLDTLMTSGVNAANSSDGTSAVSVSPAGWAAGETQRIKLCWGLKDGALKKQLFLNGVASALVDFDGSYTIADNLHLFFNNPELNYLKSIKVRKEPTWTA